MNNDFLKMYLQFNCYLYNFMSRPINFYTGEKLINTEICWQFPDDKTCNGMIVPIYIPEGSSSIIRDGMFIMFRASERSNRTGKIEFLGGRRDENDVTAIDTAIREAYEESFKLIKIEPADLYSCPYKKVWSSFVFYPRFDKLDNAQFQENRQILLQNAEENRYFLEMDKLIYVKISEFYDCETMKPIYPNKREIFKVRDVDGQEHSVWLMSAMAAWGFFTRKLPLNIE
jgi:hypothetical protein